MAASSTITSASTNNLVQYVIVRGDLKWPTGALIGQGCHASVAAIFNQINDPRTNDYLKDLDHMTKVVLKAESEQQIIDASTKLEENGIKYYIWREQPENIITALATIPHERETLKPLLSNFKLFR
ncbi:peptidyl-tRNA hydrolase domain-containing protein 1 [Blomia tropicalis]|nr:peptidyl-tRNA hydrolase domain-containing protein 1 [Blomia tropicalis]